MSSAIRATDRHAPAGGWRHATVSEIAHPTPRGVLLRLAVDDRVEPMAGHHYVVRLSAPDGYTAQRSYSVASPPSDPLCELFVEQLDEGEVSTDLAEDVMVGDVLDVRGPIGGWFVWDGTSPAVGIAGGTGVVPLVAMLRHAEALGRGDLLHLVVSAHDGRTPLRRRARRRGGLHRADP
jgi:ferredoxin-NADP reductase